MALLLVDAQTGMNKQPVVVVVFVVVVVVVGKQCMPCCYSQTIRSNECPDALYYKLCFGITRCASVESWKSRLVGREEDARRAFQNAEALADEVMRALGRSSCWRVLLVKNPTLKVCSLSLSLSHVISVYSTGHVQTDLT